MKKRMSWSARLARSTGGLVRLGLEEAYPYLILDARYERVREDGVTFAFYRLPRAHLSNLDLTST